MLVLVEIPCPPVSALGSATSRWVHRTRTTESPLVLGDTVCVFETTGTRRFKPFDDADDVCRVFLPISGDRALVGTPYRARPKLDPSRLNKAVVRCSYEFFVSSVKLRSDSSLPSSIGRWSGLLTEDDMRAIIDRIGVELTKGNV